MTVKTPNLITLLVSRVQNALKNQEKERIGYEWEPKYGRKAFTDRFGDEVWTVLHIDGKWTLYYYESPVAVYNHNTGRTWSFIDNIQDEEEAKIMMQYYTFTRVQQFFRAIDALRLP